MRLVLIATLGAAWAFGITYSLILRHLLRETLWFKHLNSGQDAGSDTLLPAGARAPALHGVRLDTGDPFSLSEPVGHERMLLFVSPSDSRSLLYRHLGVAIHALWHRAEQHLLLVCSGT